MFLFVYDVGAIILAFVLYICFRQALRPLRILRLPFPPGPPAKWILGNVADIPSSEEWIAYAKMGKIYGPVMHFQIFSRHLIVINGYKQAIDMMDKKSAIYSDRPAFPMLCGLMGWDWATAMMPYGDRWREHRKVLNQYFHHGKMHEYFDLQRRANSVFLRSLLEFPEKFRSHTRRVFAAEIMSMAYSYEVGLEKDSFVTLAEEAVDTIAKAGLPGSHLVDWFPMLKHLPDWFPGAGFKRNAKEWRKLSSAAAAFPFDDLKRRMAAGVVPHCMVADLLEAHTSEFEQDAIKCAGANAYLAGAETTSSTLLFLLRNLALHPEVQKKAQEEIDHVVGQHRLPEFSDRDSLPYVEATLREGFRTGPALTLGVPHRLLEEDEYEGMRIPAGSTVLPNLWAMLNDETVYHEPSHFTPERFLRGKVINDAAPNPHDVVFGFGRRICPGRHFADSALWLATATILACFDVRKAIENGVEVEPAAGMRSGLTSVPVEYKCSITPRHDRIKGIVLDAVSSDE